MKRESPPSWLVYVFYLSAVLFLFAALKPLFVDRPINVAFLPIGALCLVIAVAITRKRSGSEKETRP